MKCAAKEKSKSMAKKRDNRERIQRYVRTSLPEQSSNETSPTAAMMLGASFAALRGFHMTISKILGGGVQFEWKRAEDWWRLEDDSAPVPPRGHQRRPMRKKCPRPGYRWHKKRMKMATSESSGGEEKEAEERRPGHGSTFEIDAI
jgi:hypothetical protein